MSAKNDNKKIEEVLEERLDKDKHIKDLKFRTKELKDLIEKHATALDKIHQQTYLDGCETIEEMRLLRLNTLCRCRLEPEEY